MLTTLDLGPHIVAYCVEGKLDRGDIDRVFADMDAKLAGSGRVRVYADVLSLSGISLDALWQDILKSVQHWRSVTRIERVAVVSDVEWLKRASTWEGKLFPGMELRTFPLAQQAEAQAWLRA